MRCKPSSARWFSVFPATVRMPGCWTAVQMARISDARLVMRHERVDEFCALQHRFAPKRLQYTRPQVSELRGPLACSSGIPGLRKGFVPSPWRAATD